MTIAPPAPSAGASLIIENAQLIGGDWVPAASGETIDVINPATGEVLGRVPRGTAADVDAAVRAALAAGGRVLMARTTIAGVGHLVFLADPSDNVVGVMQYDPDAEQRTAARTSPRSGSNGRPAHYK